MVLRWSQPLLLLKCQNSQSSLEARMEPGIMECVGGLIGIELFLHYPLFLISFFFEFRHCLMATFF